MRKDSNATRDHKHQIIWIDQQAYIQNTLKRFRLQDANNTNTPLPARIHLEKSEDLSTTETKTTLIYATISTRPNIAFSPTQLSGYNNNPMELHIKHLLCYL